MNNSHLNRLMRNPVLRGSLLLAGCVAAICAHAEVPGKGQLGSLRAVELSVEATAGSVVVPSDTAGTLLVTPCSGCAPLALQSDLHSQYLLGDKPVAPNVWHAAALTKPQSPVVVLYVKDGHKLTRVLAPSLRAAASGPVVSKPVVSKP